MADETKVFEGWAILELMGHRRLAGYVTEVEIAGHGMLRLDIPGYTWETGGGEIPILPATQFYSPSSLYCLTPTTEDIARALRVRPSPVHRWELEAPAAHSVRVPDEQDHPLGDVMEGF